VAATAGGPPYPQQVRRRRASEYHETIASAAQAVSAPDQA